MILSVPKFTANLYCIALVYICDILKKMKYRFAEIFKTLSTKWLETRSRIYGFIPLPWAIQRFQGKEKKTFGTGKLFGTPLFTLRLHVTIYGPLWHFRDPLFNHNRNPLWKTVYPPQRKHLPQTNNISIFCEGIPLNLETVVAILVISVAVLTYAKHPLTTSQQDTHKQTTKV